MILEGLREYVVSLAGVCIWPAKAPILAVYRIPAAIEVHSAKRVRPRARHLVRNIDILLLWARHSHLCPHARQVGLGLLIAIMHHRLAAAHGIGV
jgi:hypothetical protein